MTKTYHIYIYKHYEFECRAEEEARKLAELKNPLNQNGLIAQSIEVKK